MDLGLSMFPTDTAIPPDRLAREAEARGFESLFFPEHTHIPVSRRTPYPAGGPLPEEYARSLDPFVALGAAAAVTQRIRLGTAVCLVAQRDPIVLAKEVASLEVVPVWAREDRGTLEHYATLGVTRAILGLPAASTDQVLPILDRYRKLMDGLST